MRTKITDVARRAGVSVSTVSHVINKTRFVSDETAKRVLDAINELGYTPDAAAQVLKTGKRMMIGFVVPDISNPVFAQLIECIENAVSVHGYKLVIINTRDSAELEKNAIKSLSSGIADGIIVATSAKTIDDLTGCIPDGFPLIFVDRELEHYQQDSVVLDCYDATVEMLSELIGAGHHNIGFVVGIPYISPIQERVKAYRDVFEKENLEFNPEMIRYLEKSKQRADEEIQKLIDAQCTAIVGTSTMITLDLLNHMQSHSDSLEQNICLCGFADSYLAKRFSDEIPTVDEPIDAMGKRAGEMILEKIADPGVSFPIERISCTYKSNSLQKAP